MLRINRLRVEINTIQGLYGTDISFDNGLNLIESYNNTLGKSSIVEAILYCLGFEQIIGGAGGIGSKVLTSVFKTTLEDNNKSLTVTESGAYLEINNGKETHTIFRNIKSENKDNRLITVYYGNYDSIRDYRTQSEDYYVNIQKSATSDKGFHTYLESFLHMNLPLIPTYDKNERKLYLQVIFASMFIEQKHGWSDILSGMPIFGFREAKKRIIEYILNLDTLSNEKEREKLKIVKNQLDQDWRRLVDEYKHIVNSESCDVLNLPAYPCVLSDNDISRIKIINKDAKSLEEEIELLKLDYKKLYQLKPNIIENFDLLNQELSETHNQINDFENKRVEISRNICNYNETIKRLENDLEIINTDIRNNKDAERLRKFGSDIIGINYSTDTCPVCKQRIHDNLIQSDYTYDYMNIEENISHLEEQKKLLDFSLRCQIETRDNLLSQKHNLENDLKELSTLANALRSDLYSSVVTDSSETIAIKRIETNKRIEKLELLKNTSLEYLEKLKKLSERWNNYIEQKSKLPPHDISSSDEDKISLLKEKFINNLKRFHYSSVTSFDGIDISMDSSLLPTIDGFDMKFDSSASDGIRVIWAFSIALLQVSIEKNGNHPGIIIFDEPAQQSIVPEDLKSFIDSVIEINESSQIITAITLNSLELRKFISELDGSKYHDIHIEGKSFKPF